MSAAWKTVRVFISSTFRDMAAERDHLMRVVFPDLEQRCIARGFPFIAVDLRWGVTAAQAENGETLDICLDEIERCRPFFVCLLGERYGWVPLPRVVAREFADRLEADAARVFREAYVENVGYYEYLAQPDAVLDRLWGDERSANEQSLLHALEALGVPNAGASITAQEIYHGVLADPEQKMHGLFYFRDPALTASFAAGQPEDFYESTDEGRAKLAGLKAAIADAGLDPQPYADIEALGNLLLDELWARIIEEHPAERPAPRDPLSEEREAQALFVERLTGFFVGRRDELAALDRLVAQSPRGYIAVTGPSGCGKTALLANWLYGHDGFVSRHPEMAVLSHFIGAGARSANAREILSRLCQELAPVAQWAEPVPGDFNQLTAAFREVLTAAAGRHPILLVLDALDQLEAADNARSLNWLHATLPDNVLIVASSLSGDEHATWQPLAARAGERVLQVPLLDRPTAEQMIVEFLDVRRKRLDAEQLAALAAKPDIGSPLYLQVALNELLAFGEFEGLPKFVRDLPGTIPAIYEFALEHLEREYERPFVERVMSCLACGRAGMTEQELLALAEMAGEDVGPLKWARMYRILAPHLLHHGEVLAFYHRQLREAVERRYLPHDEARRQTHADIARYFVAQRLTDRRKLDEQPFQQLAAELWPDLAATLTDYEFVEAKSGFGMAFGLAQDYVAAEQERYLGALGAEEAVALDDWRTFVGLSAEALAAGEEPHLQLAWNFADSGPVADAALLRSRGYTKPWMRLTRRPPYLRDPGCLQVIRGGGGRVAMTADGRRVVSGHAVWDAGTGERLTALEPSDRGVLELALSEDGGRAFIVTGREEVHATLEICVWDLQAGVCRGRTRDSIDNGRAIAVTPDLRFMARGGSSGKPLSILDLGTGRCMATLGPPESDTLALAISSDARRVVSYGSDYALAVWDARDGMRVHAVDCPDHYVNAIILTADGTRAVTAGGRDDAVRLWDLDAGSCLLTLKGHTKTVRAVSVTPDGRYAVSGGWDLAVRLWDLEAGQCIRTLNGHEDAVWGVAITPDASEAVSSSWDGTIRVWNLRGQDLAEQVERHGGEVNAVAFAFDGKHTVSLGRREKRGAITEESEIKLWSLPDARCMRTMECRGYYDRRFALVAGGHSIAFGDGFCTKFYVLDLETGYHVSYIDHNPLEGVRSIAVSPDGRLAFLGKGFTSYDDYGPDRGGEILVWDLVDDRCVRTLAGHEADVNGVALAPDGTRLLSGAGSAYGELRLWDVGSGECLVTVPDCQGSIEDVAVTPDGERAVSMHSNGTLGLWDMESCTCLKRIKAHTAGRGLATFPDGRWVATTGADHMVRIWDLQTGQQEAGFRCPAPALCCAVSADGRFLVAGERAGRVHVRELMNLDLGPPVLTAYFPAGGGFGAVGCPLCRGWSDVSPSALGTELPCPNCDGAVRLNPFTIDADWRPIARVWRGED